MADGHLDATERSIIITRVFEAPPALVFEAFTDPGHLARWWGPDGFSITTASFDFRVGGVWRFVMHGPDGRDYHNRVTFTAIAPPSRLVLRYGGDEEGLEPVQHHTTITLEDLDGRTRLTLALLFPDAAQRDMVLREYKAEEGGQQTLARLDAMLAEDLFVISRRLAAPRALVWTMWTEAEHLAQWWGPKGFTWLSGSLDLRPGGIFHYGMKSPKGEEMWGRFVFHEIVAPERLSFVNSFSDRGGAITRAPFFADWPLEVFNILTLAGEGNETVLTLRGAPVHASPVERDRFRAHHASMQGGFGASFEQLKAYLETQR